MLSTTIGRAIPFLFAVDDHEQYEHSARAHAKNAEMPNPTDTTRTETRQTTRHRTLRFLCRRCHMLEDGRLDNFKQASLTNLVKAVAAAAEERRSRTTCKRGHLLSGDNLYVNRRGARVCKECRKIHKRRHRLAGGAK